MNQEKSLKEILVSLENVPDFFETLILSRELEEACRELAKYQKEVNTYYEVVTKIEDILVRTSYCLAEWSGKEIVGLTNLILEIRFEELSSRILSLKAYSKIPKEYPIGQNTGVYELKLEELPPLEMIKLLIENQHVSKAKTLADLIIAREDAVNEYLKIREKLEESLSKVIFFKGLCEGKKEEFKKMEAYKVLATLYGGDEDNVENMVNRLKLLSFVGALNMANKN